MSIEPACTTLCQERSKVSHGLRGRVRRLLGDLDDATVAEILKLQPTLLELELAAEELDGRADVPIKGEHHLSPMAAQIGEIVLSDEEAPEHDG